MTEEILALTGIPLPESPIEAEPTTLFRQAFDAVGPLQGESERRWTDPHHTENSSPYADYTVVGFLEPTMLERGLSRTLITSHTQKNATVPEDKAAVKRLVPFSYGKGDVRYQLRNAVTYELDMIHEVQVILSKVFLWIGVGVAVFAALMLANFITVSISYKKQEIGILRTIGSRSNDVFRIFFAESFIIAMINFLLSAVGFRIATAIINYAIRHEAGILLTMLNFGPRKILRLLAVGMLVAAVASFFPVRRIAAKCPIDAIRGR